MPLAASSPPWLLTLGFGHNDMYSYRLIERLGRNSASDPRPRHGTSPEQSRRGQHHADGRPEGLHPDNRPWRLHFRRRAQRPRPMTSIFQKPYSMFAAENGTLAPGYGTQTVDADDFQHDTECLPRHCFPGSRVRALFSPAQVLEDFADPLPQGRKLRHQVSEPCTIPPTAEETRRLMNSFSSHLQRNLDRLGAQMLTKLWKKTTEFFVVASAVRDAPMARADDGIDGQMVRLSPLMLKPGLHSHQGLVPFTVPGLGLPVELSTF